MVDFQDFDEQGGMSKAGVVMALLEFGGLFIMVLAAIWGINAFVELIQQDAVPFRDVMVTALQLFGGVMGGLVFVALGELMRRVGMINDTSDTLVAMQRELSRRRHSQGAGSDDYNAALLELVVLMREVRDISLLTDEQRKLRLEAQGRAVMGTLQREVPALLREHNWITARNRVQEARERFPALKEWDDLERQIEEMRLRVEQHDIEAAQRQVADLVSLGAWDRVAEVVNELLQRHPDASGAVELAQRLRSERNKAEAEQSARLMAQAQEAANAREWRKALSLATTLVQRYPKSPESHALQMQLPTLRENAEIQTRREMEEEYRTHIAANRLDAALEVAHTIVQQYPDSPQALALRDQITKLEARLRG